MWSGAACALNLSALPRPAPTGRASRLATLLSAHIATATTSPAAAAAAAAAAADAPTPIAAAARRAAATPGGASEGLRALQAHHAATKQLLDDDDAACALVEALARDGSADAALAALSLAKPTPRLLQAAAAALAARRSARGVAGVQAAALAAGLLAGRDSAPTWFALVRAYGELDRTRDARAAFSAARKAGAWAPADVRGTNQFLNALASDAPLAFKRARQLLDEGAAADAVTFATLLKACMRARDAPRARRALRWAAAAGVAADASIYASAIRAFSYAGDFAGVLRVRAAMAAAGFAPPPPVWGALLVACGAANQLEAAEQAWREARAAAAAAGAPPAAEVCEAWMSACCACGAGERALAALAEMRSAAGAAPPGTRAFNLGIKACGAPPGRRLRRESLVAALALYAEMRLAGAAPDAVTYGTLLELCAEARQGRAAAQLLARARAEGVPTNVVMLTSALKALARGGDVDGAVAEFRAMVWGPARAKPNRETFRVLVRELREAGAPGAALAAYESMRRAGHAPSNRELRALLAAAAEAALAAGDPALLARVASLCGVTPASLEAGVDLHGLSECEARAAVLCALGLALGAWQRARAAPARLVLITGRGGHSAGGRAVLPGAVRRLLEEELKLAAEPAPAPGDEGGNAGRVVVEGAALAAWLQARGAARERAAAAVAAAAAGAAGAPAAADGDGPPGQAEVSLEEFVGPPEE
jgi:hypothetical protein